MFSEIDFKKGRITYNDFDIDFSKPLEDQIFSLKEDLFQAEYNSKEKYLIDIGWYPEMNPKGKFKIRVIKNFDWLNPLYLKECKAKNKLIAFLKEAIDLIDQQLKT